MQLQATSRPTGDTAADSHTWTIEADTYEAAFEQACVETPAGSTLLYVRPER